MQPNGTIWSRNDSIELSENQIVAVWNRGIELTGVDQEVGIVWKDGSIRKISDRTTQIELSYGETMIRHIGWFSSECTAEHIDPEHEPAAAGEAAPLDCREIPVHSLTVQIPAHLIASLRQLQINLHAELQRQAGTEITL